MGNIIFYGKGLKLDKKVNDVIEKTANKIIYYINGGDTYETENSSWICKVLIR